MSNKEQEKTLLEKYTYNAIEFVKKHSVAFIAGLVVTILVAGGVIAGTIIIDKQKKRVLIEYMSLMDEYQEIINKEDSSDSDKAGIAERLVQLIESAKFGYVKENGYYLAGGIYFQNEKYSEAKKYFDLFLEKHSTSDFAPLAQFQSAVCSEWMDNTDAAFVIYKQMETDFEGTKFMERITYDLGRMYSMKGDLEKAKEYYNRVMTEYPSSFYATQSKKRLMLLNYEEATK